MKKTEIHNEVERVKMLSKENTRLREAGCELAIASMRVVKEYDGLHRLSLAVANWAKAVADEGGRNNITKKKGAI